MTTQHVLILGAGAAGSAASRVLTAAGVRITMVDSTPQGPYNRMLLNKGVAIGMLSPQQIALPDPGAPLLSDTAVSIRATEPPGLPEPSRASGLPNLPGTADSSTALAGSVDHELATDRSQRRRGVIVEFASGASLSADAVIVATGSAAATATLHDVAGAAEAEARGRLTFLHSLDDALRIRDSLTELTQLAEVAGRTAPASARIAILGGGLLGAETASLLAARGAQVTVVARSKAPGAAAFGPTVAAELIGTYHEHTATHLGRTVTDLSSSEDDVTVTLDDDTALVVDLVVVAHGTRPTGPTPWDHGVPVGPRLRLQAHETRDRNDTPARCDVEHNLEPLKQLEHSTERDIDRRVEPDTADTAGTADYWPVYAAGGVALHHDDLIGQWRIDHWTDSVAQGEHAAHSVLADLGIEGHEPGPYLPRAMHSAVIHGVTVLGAGYTGAGTVDRVISADPLVVVHQVARGHGDTAVGVTGINAPVEVAAWLNRLHLPPAPDQLGSHEQGEGATVTAPIAHDGPESSGDAGRTGQGT